MCRTCVFLGSKWLNSSLQHEGCFSGAKGRRKRERAEAAAHVCSKRSSQTDWGDPCCKNLCCQVLWLFHHSFGRNYIIPEVTNQFIVVSLQVNESVLRPASMEPLSDLQLAEELIKQEMITMLHHDCLHHPTSNAASQLQRGKNRGPASTSNNASHIAYLETHPYQQFSSEDMEQVTKSDCFMKMYTVIWKH